MSRKSLLLLVGLAMLAPYSRAADNPWSNLKKIYFYDASGDIAAVRSNLDQLQAQALSPTEKTELLQKLDELGDGYYQKKNFPLAEAFYRKMLDVSPKDAWPIYNKLEKIRRRQGSLFLNPANAGRQFLLISRNFAGAFLLLNNGLNVLFFASLFLFFLSTIVMFLKYFKLALHDFLLAGSSTFQVKNLLLMLLLLLWPLAVLGGWGFYPFPFCAFLWPYFTHDERVNTQRILGILLVMTLVSSFNNYLEKSLQSPGFQTIKNIYAGQLYPESSYSRFDNETKIMQAYAYYNQHQPDAALDVLQATGSQYTSTLKLNLQGNIYFEKGNMLQSIQFFRQSLSLDDQNKLTLKNFTLALLKNNDPELFTFYLKNYPEIKELKDKVGTLQRMQLPEKFLWQRLLNHSWQDFHFWNFLSHIVVEFFKIPVLLAILILLVYITLLKKFSLTLGQSTFCSKCRKIIKKKSIEQAHALCEECYQLFLIKDPIFLEAKLLKEKEIVQKSRLKFSASLVASLLVPGFCLHFKNKSHIFTFAFLLFSSVLCFYVSTALTFKSFFGTVPLFINLVGIFAAILYLLINLYSLRGDDNGF